MADTKGRGHQPPTLAELQDARTDYRDVPVEALGGKVLRLYALSGTARARLMPSMASLAKYLPQTGEDEPKEGDPKPLQLDEATTTKVFMFQIRVVGASLGYPEDQWDAVGSVLGDDVIDQLFDIASELSGLSPAAQDEAVQRLRPKRSAASGTA